MCSYVVALWGFRLRAAMGTASPLQCLSLTSCGSQFVELSCSTRGRTLSASVSSSCSSCFGVRWRLRCGSVELPCIGSRSHRRQTVAASTCPFKVRWMQSFAIYRCSGIRLEKRGARDDELHPMFKWVQHFCPCFCHTSYHIFNCGRCN